jgi:hypothetical protein
MFILALDQEHTSVIINSRLYCFTGGLKNIFVDVMSFLFFLSYLFIAIKVLFVYIYACIKLNLFFKTSLKKENELALAILKSKTSSYFNHLIEANMHYKNMKKYLGKLIMIIG